MGFRIWVQGCESGLWDYVRGAMGKLDEIALSPRRGHGCAGRPRNCRRFSTSELAKCEHVVASGPLLFGEYAGRVCSMARMWQAKPGIVQRAWQLVFVHCVSVTLPMFTFNIVPNINCSCCSALHKADEDLPQKGNKNVER